MKRLTLLSAALCLISVCTAAAESDIPEVSGGAVIVSTEEDGAEKETKYFTLEKAVEYAVENSYQLKAKKAEITAAETDLAQAKAGKYQAGRIVSSFAELSPYVTNGYYVSAAEVGLNVANRAYQQAEYELKGSVEKSFYTYISLLDKIENAQTSIANAEARYAEAQKKLEKGTVPKLDVTSFELALTKARNTYSALLRSKETALAAFKNTIGYPMSDPVELVGSFERRAMDETPVDTAIQRAKTNITYMNLEDSYTLAQQKLSVDKSYYSSNQFEYRSSVADFAKTEADYYNNKAAIQLGVRSAYDTMLTKYDTLAYMDDNLVYMESQAAAQKIRYEQGLISAQDYIETLQSLDELKNSIKDTEIEAFGAVLDYRATYTYEYIE